MSPFVSFFHFLCKSMGPSSESASESYLSCRNLSDILKTLPQRIKSFQKPSGLGGGFHCTRMRTENFPRASEIKVFAKNPHILSLKLYQASEYSIILCEFLAKTLTSEALRKFSMRRAHTF